MGIPIQLKKKATRCTKLESEFKSKLEEIRNQELDLLLKAGEIQCYGYEQIKLRLAEKGKQTFYTPDFFYIDNDGQIWIEEVKGFWREAAKVRIKVAASRYPWFRFCALQRKKVGGWKIEEF